MKNSESGTEPTCQQIKQKLIQPRVFRVAHKSHRNCNPGHAMTRYLQTPEEKSEVANHTARVGGSADAAPQRDRPVHLEQTMQETAGRICFQGIAIFSDRVHGFNVRRFQVT